MVGEAAQARRLQNGILLIALFAFLFGLFRFNWPHLANAAWFENFQIDSTALVVGRIAAARCEGFWSHSGMLGYYQQGQFPLIPQLPFQERIYLGKQKPAHWEVYVSQLGLQGFLFSYMALLLPPQPWVIGLLGTLTALFNAALLTSLFWWLRSEIGLSALAGVLAGILFSPWLIVFGPNLYWMLGLFFLPMLLMAWGLRKKWRWRCLMPALFGAFFLKFGCGYEYLTTVCIAAWTPVVFYAYRDKWDIRRLIKISCTMGAIAIAAFLAVFTLQVTALSMGTTGNIADAAHLVLMRGAARFALSVPGVEKAAETVASLHVSSLEVIDQYMKGMVGFHAPSLFMISLPPTFGDLILIAAAISFALRFARHAGKKERRSMIALMIAMWIGLAGAFSWYGLATQHAFMHTHISYVLYYIPFALFLFALVGKVIENMINRIGQGVNTSSA